MKKLVSFLIISIIVINSIFAQWNTQTISKVDGVGKNNQIVNLSNGEMLVFSATDLDYYDKLNVYKWTGSGWAIERYFDTSKTTDISFKINKENNGELSLAYGMYESTYDDFSLNYARRSTSGVWTVENVDNNYNTDYSYNVSCVCILQNFKKCIITTYTGNNDLIMYQNSGDSWIKSGTIDNSVSAVSGTSDGQNIYLSYQQSGDLKIAYYDGSEWSTQVIDEESTVGDYTSITLDADNNPNIAYYDATSKQLKHIKLTMNN